MSHFVQKIDFTTTIKTAIMLGGLKLSTGQWVNVSEQYGHKVPARLVVARKFKALPLPLKVSVVKWNPNESFKDNNARFYRAVNHTK